VIVERRGAAGRERGPRAGVPQERLVDVGAIDVAETGRSGRRAAGVVGDDLLSGMDVNHVIARFAPRHAPAQGVVLEGNFLRGRAAIGIRPPQAIVKIPDQPQRRAGQRRRAAEQVPLGVVAERAGRAARG